MSANHRWYDDFEVIAATHRVVHNRQVLLADHCATIPASLAISSVTVAAACEHSLGFLPVEPDATLSHTTCAVLRSGRGAEVIASVPLLAANEVPKIRKLRELKKENWKITFDLAYVKGNIKGKITSERFCHKSWKSFGIFESVCPAAFHFIQLFPCPTEH